MQEIKKIAGWYNRSNERGIYIPNPSAQLAKHIGWTPSQRALSYTTSDGPDPDVVNIGFFTRKLFESDFDHCYYCKDEPRRGWMIFGWVDDPMQCVERYTDKPWLQYWVNPRSREPRNYMPPTISNYFLASDLDPEHRREILDDFVPAESANKYERIFIRKTK